MKPVLAIDTASETFALTLGHDGAITRSLSRDGARDHSRLLLAAVDELMDGRRHDLGGIIVTLGPGSYAGLRVGIATTQGLALTLGIPLRGIGTMPAIAAAAGPDVTAVHPAGRGDFAVQAFRGGEPATALRVLPGTDSASLGRLAGEGAADHGGIEVTPEQRCRAALLSTAPALATASGEVEAIYLREPSITISRRAAGAARTTSLPE